MSGTPEVPFEPALEQLGQALVGDRAHVLLAAGGVPGAHRLPTLLADHLAGRLEVVLLELGGIPPDAAPQRIAAAAGLEGPSGLVESRLLAAARRLRDQHDGALVLAVADAEAVPVATLTLLGALAQASHRDLRLALFASDPARIGGLVAALGVGVEKVVLEVREGRGAGRARRPARELTARSERIASPPPAPRPRAAPGARTWVAGLGAAGVVLALLSLGVVTWHGEGTPAPEPPSVAAAPVPAREPAPAKRVAPELGPGPASSFLATPSLPLVVAERRASPPSTPRPPAAPVAPPAPGPRPIAVSINADPWAEVAVDGRELGSTPLAGVELTPGSHRLRARFPDGRVLEREIVIDPVRNRFRLP